jgi:uncharacterized phage protein (TIGR02218 family)
MSVPVSEAYVNFVLSAPQAIMGHLYEFISIDGQTDYFTDLDQDVTWGGVLWKSTGLRITGFRRKLAVGLQVDEQNVKIWATPTDTLFGGNFLTGAEEGLLDGVLIKRLRIVWNNVSGNAAYDMANNVPMAVWVLFTGYTSKISKGGQSHVEMTVKSPLVKLAVNMPRNYYQPGCLWNLFDGGCTLNEVSFAVNKIIAAGASYTTLPITGGLTALGPDGISQYAQGRIEFTSGVNEGLLTLIDSNDAGNVYLAYPLNALPAAGDGVTLWPGCSKSFSTCQQKYNNSNNFRGFDKVPPICMSA